MKVNGKTIDPIDGPTHKQIVEMWNNSKKKREKMGRKNRPIKDGDWKIKS